MIDVGGLIHRIYLSNSNIKLAKLNQQEHVLLVEVSVETLTSYVVNLVVLFLF